MNNIDIIEFNKLKEENEELKKKNNELEDKLKSYTNNHRHKKYYDNNSDTSPLRFGVSTKNSDSSNLHFCVENTKVYLLEENYRSSPEIVYFCQNIISKNII
jgi:hypothetical protein